MITTFEADFGDIKIPKIKVKTFTQSPTEENEFFVRIWDAEDTLKHSIIPQGVATIRRYIKVPPKCPNCQYELHNLGTLHYEIKEVEVYEYKGVTVRGMAAVEGYDEDVIELRLHYETMEYKNDNS